MCKIVDIGEKNNVALEFDDYIPFEVIIGSEIIDIDRTYYLRYTDDRYLLEVKISSETGKLNGVRLVLIQKENVACDNCGLSDNIENATGTPIFDVEKWKKRIGGKEFGIDPDLRVIDKAENYHLIIGESSMLLTFNDRKHAKRIMNESFSVLLDQDDCLSGIYIDNIDKHNICKLANSTGVNK
jgi:hypothetical protein